MSTSDTARYPEPDDSDLEEVHCALSVGTTLWCRGDETEALKWLRRAATAAADRDADLRAVELFKAAADITTQMESPGGTPDDGGAAAKKKRQASRDKRAAEPRAASRVPRRRGFSDSDPEMTIVRPETALRRALTRIDPNYPQRIDLPESQAPESQAPESQAPESQSPRPLPAAGRPAATKTGEDPSGVHQRGDPPASTRRGISQTRPGAAPHTLPAIRVALLPIADEGEIRLLFLDADEDAPPGVTTAMLVATTPEEAEHLRALLENTDAKL
jgi:hypothetical protein